VQVGKVAAYEARSALLGESVKGQHVLPFFRNFVAMAARLEDLVAASLGASCLRSVREIPRVPELPRVPQVPMVTQVPPLGSSLSVVHEVPGIVRKTARSHMGLLG
jgi:hypothetical protein